MKSIKLSRSRLELFIECPRCFWLMMTKKLTRPKGPPFTLNMAIDTLLKHEFDVARNGGFSHPLMKKFNVNAVPYQHEELNTWRNNFKGIQHEHKESGFLVYGAIDDIWITPEKKLHVVDYKATGAKEYKIYDSYKRQMEIYQWLFKKNNFDISPTGYFVFAHVNKDVGFSDAKLSFDMYIEPCEGDNSWIEDALMRAKACIDGTEPPMASTECEFCKYHFRQLEI